MLADPVASQGGSGAFAAGSERWPFVVNTFPTDGQATQLVGLSSRWLLRLMGERDAGQGLSSDIAGAAAASAVPDALPLSTLLAAVDRLLPLPQLPKKGDQKGGASSACDGPEAAREKVVVHLAAAVLLQDAADQCGWERDWGDGCSGRGTAEQCGWEGAWGVGCRRGRERLSYVGWDVWSLGCWLSWRQEAAELCGVGRSLGYASLPRAQMNTLKPEYMGPDLARLAYFPKAYFPKARPNHCLSLPCPRRFFRSPPSQVASPKAAKCGCRRQSWSTAPCCSRSLVSSTHPTTHPPTHPPLPALYPCLTPTMPGTGLTPVLEPPEWPDRQWLHSEEATSDGSLH